MKTKSNFVWTGIKKLQSPCPICKSKDLRRIYIDVMKDIWVCYGCGQAQYIKKKKSTFDNPKIQKAYEELRKIVEEENIRVMDLFLPNQKNYK